MYMFYLSFLPWPELPGLVEKQGVPDPWHFQKDSDPYRSAHWITDSNPALFVSGFQDANKKSFFAYYMYLLWVQFFFIFLLAGGRIRIREAQKLTDPDPDPKKVFQAFGKPELVEQVNLVAYVPVLRIWIRIHRIHMFLSLRNPDPDPFVIKQK